MSDTSKIGMDDDLDTATIDRHGLDREDDTQEPKRYKVVFVNDDFTPMDWVRAALMYHFRKSESEAKLITLQIHNTGKGIAGIFPRDIADTKSLIVNMEAQKEGHPLLTEVEEE